MGGLLGARHLASRLQHDGHHIDRMIIAEPTMCAPVHGHKGGVGLEICVHGHAAHSSRPELGANAIAAAARIIAALDKHSGMLLIRSDADLASDEPDFGAPIHSMVFSRDGSKLATGLHIGLFPLDFAIETRPKLLLRVLKLRS